MRGPEVHAERTVSSTMRGPIGPRMEDLAGPTLQTGRVRTGKRVQGKKCYPGVRRKKVIISR
jgi:hypothetical protein